MTLVSRTRCGILHAAPQSHSASKTRVIALMAKSYALRCVRGTQGLLIWTTTPPSNFSSLSTR
jgi:hypothetical protein